MDTRENRRDKKAILGAWLLGALVLSSAAPLGASLPAWTDDSGLSITLSAEKFAPARGPVILTGRVFHPIDGKTSVAWKISVRGLSGQEQRSFLGSQSYQPGEPMEFSTSWDGRSKTGRLVPDGLYRVLLEVEMRSPSGAGMAARSPGADPGDPESREERADVIRQSFLGFVTVKASLENSPSPSQVQVLAAPNEPGFPFNFYFGTLHTQTSYSDGGHPNDVNCASSTTHGPSDFDPAQAYGYARNTARLDFLGISDHNHLFDNACSGCSAPQVIQRYHSGLTAASAASVDGSFVAIYGMEWGYIGNNNFPNQGHINLYETPKLFGWEPSGCTVGLDCYYEVFTDPAGASYPAMYTKALANPSAWGAFGQFNHPSNSAGVDYNQFQYTTDGDDLIHAIAVNSGPATDYSTTATDTGYRYSGDPVGGPQYSFYTTIDMYNRALGAGFHVAPTSDSDVHCSNYGTSTRDRTVILSTALTKAALLDAIHHRRVYASSDANTQLVFTMIAGATTYYMGDGGIRSVGPIATSGAIMLHTSVWDPDSGEIATSIKIKEPVPNNTNGSATVIATGTSSPFDFTFTPAAGKHTYYVYVTLSNGNELWSAPIWINQSSTPPTPDFSLSVSPSSVTVPPAGGTATYTVSITRTGGFGSAVGLSVTGLPVGASGSFNPASTTANSSTLTVTAGSATAAGSYLFTVTGTGGSPTLTRTATATLVKSSPATLAVTSISAACGNVTGGRALTITGSGFQTGAAVNLVGTAAVVNTVTATSISITTGSRLASPAVTGDLVVTNPDTGVGTLAGAFTYGVRGDANNNGGFTPSDASWLNDYFAGAGPPPAFPCIGGDANATGSFTPADASYLNDFFAGAGPAPGP